MILAMDKCGGIGLRGRLPWHNREELQLFKKWTIGHKCIVGSVTARTLPNLVNRDLYVLSRRSTEYNTFESITRECDPTETVWVIGGAQVYKKALATGKVKQIILSIMDGEYDCDTFVDIPRYDWRIQSQTRGNHFTQYVLEKHVDPYMKCLSEVIKHGDTRTGRNGFVLSQFGKTLQFDLRQGFPLVTTKKMFMRGIIEELLFFIRGETDTTLLEEKGVYIWRGNTTREFLDRSGFKNRPAGMMGPMYGYNWRSFGAPYDENTGLPTCYGTDQLVRLVNGIQSDPYSRRHLMTTYNPAQVEQGVLYPCHSLMLQFYVREGGLLDMACYNRSSDLFLGLPFNIASSALLLRIISHYTQLKPGKMTIHLGDAHIYQEHIDVVKEQLDRFPYAPPTLELVDMPPSINHITRENVVLKNYTFHSKLSAPMVP